MDIINEVIKYKSISIIGNYKNVGKTTTLNYILKNIANKNIILGITSIGVDGEAIDVVTETKKPRIYVTKGSLVVTAKGVIDECDVTKEILDVTPINTPLGCVVIFRALSDGYVVLCGPSINLQVRYVLDRLSFLGADLSIVDGALSRKSLCSPSVTEGTIFCSGAIIDRNINRAIDKVVYDVSVLSLLDIYDERLNSIYEDVKDYKAVVINDDYLYEVIDVNTLLNNSKVVIDAIGKECKYVLINSTVTDEFLDGLLSCNKHKNITVILRDATKLFASKDVFYKFIKCQGNIRVMEKINLIGVSINPTSINGYSFNEDHFVDRIRSNVNVEVFNVMNI